MSTIYLCPDETEEKRLEENPEGGKSLSDRIGVPPPLFAPGCSSCEGHHKDCKSTRSLQYRCKIFENVLGILWGIIHLFDFRMDKRDGPWSVRESYL